jgi:hypothetical protein
VERTMLHQLSVHPKTLTQHDATYSKIPFAERPQEHRDASVAEK